MDKKFDLEQAAFRLKTLHGMMDDVNADLGKNTWEEANNRLYVLLEAMEPIVNALYEFASKGGDQER